MKIQRLEKLCRALQTERNDLNKKVQDLCAFGAPAAGAKTPEPPKDQFQGSSDVLVQDAMEGECLALAQATCCTGPIEKRGEPSIGVLPREVIEEVANTAE